MEIVLSFGTCLITYRPPILNVTVLNFKSSKVTCFAAEKAGFLAHTDPILGSNSSQNDLLFFYSAPPGNEIAGGNTHIRPKWIKIPCNTSVHSRRAELLTVEIRNTSSYR